jgi:hypothetical protein
MLFLGPKQIKQLFSVLGLLLLIALFYAEENWRGKRAWENCKRQVEAEGGTLDWSEFIPPPVRDGQNFFSAPKMQEWLVKPPLGQTITNELVQRMQAEKYGTITASITEATNLIQTAEAGKAYLAWSEQFDSDFELIRQALKRPYARINGDYSQPFGIPMPNFVVFRAVVQTLAQRARCHLLLGQPEKALGDLTLLNDLRRVLEFPPSGKTTTFGFATRKNG